MCNFLKQQKAPPAQCRRGLIGGDSVGKYIAKSFFVDMPDGTKKEIKSRGKTDEEVQRKYDRKKWEYEMGLLTFNKNTLFVKWVEEWLETYKKPKVRSKHYNDTKNMLDRVFVPIIGTLKMADIKPVHLQNAINELEGKSASYIAKAMSTIKSIMDKAVINEIISKNPALKLEPPIGTKNSRRALTQEEQDVFIQTFTKHKYGPLFGITLACGLRPGEARAMLWFNVDKKNHKITVTQAVEAGTKNIKEPKTKAGKRVIPIPDWYVPILDNLPKTDSPLLFPNESGEILSDQNYKRAWKSFYRLVDIEAGAKVKQNQVIIHAIPQDITPYYLRHTYATKLAELGVDIKTAQYLLGHTDIKMTANIYTHVSNKMFDEAKEKLHEWTQAGQATDNDQADAIITADS